MSLRTTGKGRWSKKLPGPPPFQNKSVQPTRGEGEIIAFKHHFNNFTRTEIPAQ
jgi:hypothetical protein